VASGSHGGYSLHVSFPILTLLDNRLIFLWTFRTFNLTHCKGVRFSELIGFDGTSGTKFSLG